MPAAPFRSRNMGIRRVRVADIRDNPHNFRTHPENQAQALNEAETLLGFFGYPDVYEEPGGEGVTLVDGELRKYHLLAKYGADHEIDVNVTDFTPDEAKLALLTKDPIGALATTNKERLDALMLDFNQQKAALDPSILAELHGSLDKMLADLSQKPAGGGGGNQASNESVKLADRFLVPPFSVLDARQGYWQDRKRQWLALGIQSEVGRGENLLQFSDTVRLPPRRNMASPMNSGGCTDDVSQRINTTVRGGPRPSGTGNNAPARDMSSEYRGGDASAAARPRDPTAQTFGSGSPGDLAAGYRAAGLGAVPSNPEAAGDLNYYRNQHRARAINDHEWQRDALGNVQAPEQGSGTSIFDPVLCEIAYRWFCPPGGSVLDPFAGGSVRGIVAGKLGLEYLGVDLRPEQIEANQVQAQHILAQNDEPKRVRLSAAMLRQKFHECTPEFIANVCHASCCESSDKKKLTLITIHPSEQQQIEARGGVVELGMLQPNQETGKCPFKTCEDMCGLHGTSDKPFGCIASPFTLNANDTMIVRNRYRALKCFKADGAIEAYKAHCGSLRRIFGDEEAARITAHLDAGGGDLEATMPSQSYRMLHENDAAKHGHVAAIGGVEWVVGDSRTVVPTIDREFDLILSCPPYADLELYSDDPLDISNMPYEQFMEAYRAIIAASCAKLKPNRFAVWVIGEVRGPGGGECRGLVPATIQAFKDAGLELYNDAILVTSCGSLPLRVGRQFVISRKLGRTHQYVLVFVKGDPRQATADCGPVVIDEESLAQLASEQGIEVPDEPAAAIDEVESPAI